LSLSYIQGQVPVVLAEFALGLPLSVHSGGVNGIWVKNPYLVSHRSKNQDHSKIVPFVPAFTMKLQAPIGTLALGGGIGAAAVVGGFFKLKKNGKKRAPSANNLELSQATAV